MNEEDEGRLAAGLKGVCTTFESPVFGDQHQKPVSLFCFFRASDSHHTRHPRVTLTMRRPQPQREMKSDADTQT